MMKYSTYTWDLMQALESASHASCKTPIIFIDFIHHNNLPEKVKTQKPSSTPNKLYPITLAYVERTQGQER